MAIAIVTEAELRELIHLDEESLQVVADGFNALANAFKKARVEAD